MSFIVTNDEATKPSAPLGVVTVTYSPGHHLAEFLDSLASGYSGETYVVLADNGSTDGVPQAAARAERVEFLSTGGNLGYGAAINAAARVLSPMRERGEINDEFFLISNPDVTFSAGAVDELVACARRWESAGSVGPRIVEADGSTYPSARSVPTLGVGIGHALLSQIWPGNPFSARYRADADMSHERTAGWLSGSCVLVRWSAFEEVGGFDERYFMYLEDVDLGDRLGRAGYDNVYTPLARIHHDQGHSTKSRRHSMLPAHHRSAYRFLADRYRAWWQAPLRFLLAAGLKARGFLLTRVG
ncbi:alpha-D-GlcNAc-diphosphoryl polyprenol, alpha-3-L-rhamnosyl transferase [Corynebacterium yudongzhengii]|uniref:Glycosyltransferase family 2 protein n=1 Tax=Corynebacterium yudongzhengii TaxID=2080740 RepID=A0A2U1T7F5_9CORY|nr:glycosyltransferase family 2 protein [Corynebacterium yudongzhengii]AWB81385.1 alpha-D-GlcNAc-diphosphoryl polyprenol, alpha-3-L-rhamnosyl transferase [Corynebacterium yudongzhengii]PWC01828.1 glycosyltransferase family 2 protein [Corynebacterium yudongzhengii]